MPTKRQKKFLNALAYLNGSLVWAVFVFLIVVGIKMACEIIAKALK